MRLTVWRLSIGVGTLGDVHRVSDRATGSVLAIKHVKKSRFSPASLITFRQELDIVKAAVNVSISYTLLSRMISDHRLL